MGHTRDGMAPADTTIPITQRHGPVDRSTSSPRHLRVLLEALPQLEGDSIASGL